MGRQETKETQEDPCLGVTAPRDRDRRGTKTPVDADGVGESARRLDLIDLFTP